MEIKNEVKYEKIEKFIIGKIKNQEYMPNQKIPSENHLAKMFNVSRMTARKSIENLVSKNYVYKIERQGSFVANHDEKSEIVLDEMIGFKKRTLREGKNPSTKVLKFELKKPNNILRKKMSLGSQEKVYYFEISRYMNNEPIVFEIGYMPERLLKLEKKDLENSLHEFIYKNQLEIKKMKKEYMAIVPSKKIKDVLRLKSNSAVFKVEFTSFTRTDDIVEYAKVYYNQDKYKFVHIIKN